MNEFMRLPPDARRTIAAHLAERHGSLFRIQSREHKILDLEIENSAYGPEAAFRTVSAIECADEVLGDLIATGSGASSARYASMSEAFDAFMERHPELEPSLTGDEHYLERRFLAEVLLPVLGPEGLEEVRPQVEFEDSLGSVRRIDFVLAGEKDYAIELEGFEFHGRERIGRERFADEKLRQRDLSTAGYTYLPYAFDDVEGGEALRAFERLCVDDAKLSRLHSLNERRRSEPALTPAYEEALYLFRQFPADFHAVQILLLGKLPGEVRVN